MEIRRRRSACDEVKWLRMNGIHYENKIFKSIELYMMLGTGQSDAHWHHVKKETSSKDLCPSPLYLKEVVLGSQNFHPAICLSVWSMWINTYGLYHGLTDQSIPHRTLTKNVTAARPLWKKEGFLWGIWVCWWCWNSNVALRTPIYTTFNQFGLVETHMYCAGL